MSISKTTPKAILEALQKAFSSGPAQKLQDEFYKPRPQSPYYYNGSSWESSPKKPSSEGNAHTKSLRLISWNIDMLIGFAEERMSAALNHLSELVGSTDSNVPIIIFLQEMSQSDMQQIRETPWIQHRFYTTDLDEKNWLSPLYGTNTLIDRRLVIDQVFRVPWVSKFTRDGLFVDLALSGSTEGNVLRLCNTHLESLVADPPVRPLQLGAAAPYLHDSKALAGLLAGDLNAIQPFDRTLHSDNGLKDTYLELGGEEDSDEGFTWGQQVPQALRERFGCSRMDKILFTGKVTPRGFQRIGVGVRVAEEKRREMRDAGEEEWVTDHYGVMADFELSGEEKLVVAGGNDGEVLRSKLI